MQMQNEKLAASSILCVKFKSLAPIQAPVRKASKMPTGTNAPFVSIMPQFGSHDGNRPLGKTRGDGTACQRGDPGAGWLTRPQTDDSAEALFHRGL
jgi:hypothetical protein